jgi:hypothetical protein
MKDNRQLVIHKGRTIVVPVSLGYDVSQDTFASEIRDEKDSTSELLATWVVSFATDGTDGELLLTLDDAATALVTKTTGWMDLKRISAGEPLNVFDEPLEVLFKETITA